MESLGIFSRSDSPSGLSDVSQMYFLTTPVDCSLWCYFFDHSLSLVDVQVTAAQVADIWLRRKTLSGQVFLHQGSSKFFLICSDTSMGLVVLSHLYFASFGPNQWQKLYIVAFFSLFGSFSHHTVCPGPNQLISFCEWTYMQQHKSHKPLYKWYDIMCTQVQFQHLHFSNALTNCTKGWNKL